MSAEISRWRPSASIRVKVIGLALHDGALLAAEVLDDRGALKGVRPLGGGIEFGETREAALSREFDEELGAIIRICGPWQVFENIFEHEGQLGHEIVFAAPVVFEDPAITATPMFNLAEADGSRFTARWIKLDAIASGAVALFPDGLAEALIEPGQALA